MEKKIYTYDYYEKVKKCDYKGEVTYESEICGSSWSTDSLEDYETMLKQFTLVKKVFDKGGVESELIIDKPISNYQSFHPKFDKTLKFVSQMGCTETIKTFSVHCSGGFSE